MLGSHQGQFLCVQAGKSLICLRHRIFILLFISPHSLKLPVLDLQLSLARAIIRGRAWIRWFQPSGLVLDFIYSTKVSLAKPEFISNHFRREKTSREVESEAKSWGSQTAPKQEKGWKATVKPAGWGGDRDQAEKGKGVESKSRIDYCGVLLNWLVIFSVFPMPHASLYLSTQHTVG